MTQEDKELLLKDLCARLPYGVMLYHSMQDQPFELLTIQRKWYKSYKEDGIELAVNGKYCEVIINNKFTLTLSRFSDLKPYLRPMSSMTEEEKIEWDAEYAYNSKTFGYEEYLSKMLDWLNSHHFDYHNLIEKGLALEAPEGMYNLA